MSLVPKHIKNLSPYKQGKRIEEIQGKYNIQNIIKLASNEKISKHCREVSKKYFSNISGSKKYKELYLKLMKKK